MKAELAGVRFPSYCKSLSFLGHPVVRPCISSVPLAGISCHTIYGLSVTCHNLNVQYQKLIFCLQVGNILTTFKLSDHLSILLVSCNLTLKFLCHNIFIILVLIIFSGIYSSEE